MHGAFISHVIVIVSEVAYLGVLQRIQSINTLQVCLNLIQSTRKSKMILTRNTFVSIRLNLYKNVHFVLMEDHLHSKITLIIQIIETIHVELQKNRSHTFPVLAPSVSIL